MFVHLRAVYWSKCDFLDTNTFCLFVMHNRFRIFLLVLTQCVLCEQRKKIIDKHMIFSNFSTSNIFDLIFCWNQKKYPIFLFLRTFSNKSFLFLFCFILLHYLRAEVSKGEFQFGSHAKTLFNIINHLYSVICYCIIKIAYCAAFKRFLK